MKLFTKQFLILMLSCWASLTFAQSNVTFRVDMAQYTNLGANDTVYVNGTWNNWCGKCNPLTRPTTGTVWTGTYPIPNGAQEFKFTINGWNAQENLQTGSPCTVTNGGFTNRSINVSSAVTLPIVCWQSCSACNNLLPMNLPVNFDSTNVNYVLSDFGGNTSSIIVDPSNSNNKIASVVKSNTAELWAGTTIGTTAGFANAIPFAPGSTKIRVRVYSPDSGIVVRLKAEVAGDPTKSVETDTRTTMKDQWEVMEFNFANHVNGTAPINFTYTYKMLSIFFNFGVTGATAGTKTYRFDDVVFVSTPPPPPTKINVRFNVDVKNITMNPGDTVTLNGTFNGWCGACAKMTNLPGTSIWTTIVELDTNTEYEYKYAIGNWVRDEKLASTLSCTKTTGGFTNRVFRTGKTNDSLGLVCWEACGPCVSGGPVKSMVTFRVDLSKRGLAAGDTVTLNGTFNNWCGKCTPMTKVGSTNVWQATVELNKDSAYDYKFTIGNWDAQETLKEGLPCTTTKSGFTNRLVVPSKLMDTLPVVCWESCTDCQNTAPKAKVNFLVNMKNYVGDLSKGVTLNGSFNGWCGECTKLDSLGSFIYGTTLTLDTGEYEFKFTIGNWDDQEQFSPGDPCTKTTGNFTNRVIRILDSNSVKVGAYCWNTCTICDAVGIEEVVFNGLTLYPNPAQDRVWLDYGLQVNSKVNAIVYDLQGREVGSAETKGAQTMEISTAGLTPGLYLVKVEINKVVKTYKVTVR